MCDHGNREDAAAQRAVLSLVIDEHPTLLTPEDLAMEIEGEDAVGRAVRDLTAIGLLRREGGSVARDRAQASLVKIVRSAWSRARSRPRTRRGFSPHSFLSRPNSRSTAERPR